MSAGIREVEPLFHAECDIAAIVYDRSDDPDLVLFGFAKDLQASGKRTVGLLQLGRIADARRDHGLRTTLLLSGRTITLTHRALSPDSCALEAGGLWAVADLIAADIRKGADLVVINRFGKLELNGGGFLREITSAMALGIPVIIAVPECNFRVWTAYSGGMSVRLGCRRKELDLWWRSVSATPASATPRGSATFCGITK